MVVINTPESGAVIYTDIGCIRCWCCCYQLIICVFKLKLLLLLRRYMLSFMRTSEPRRSDGFDSDNTPRGRRFAWKLLKMLSFCNCFQHYLILYGIKGQCYNKMANKVEGSLTWRSLLRKKPHRVAWLSVAVCEGCDGISPEGREGSLHTHSPQSLLDTDPRAR